MSATKGTPQNGPIVIQNFVVARPPARSAISIANWRQAINSAELSFQPNRVTLYDIYDDVLLDPHLKRQWEKRVENITTLDWDFIDKNEVEVEEMDDLLVNTSRFEKLLKEIMLSKLYGISVLELSTELKPYMGKTRQYLKTYSIPRKHIRPETGTIVKEQYDTNNGTSAIDYRSGVYQNYIAEVGDNKDLGLLLEITPYVILKKGGVNDWALFVQLFGQPFREYTYNGYDEKVRITLEQSAKEMASAPYIIMPDGAQLKLHEIRNNNTGEVHGKLTEYCDKMISIRILGNTLTTDNGKVGSNALGEVHQQTQEEVFTSDKMFVKRVLNETIAPILYNLGYPVKDGKFTPKQEKNIEKTKKKLEVIKMVRDLGEPIDADYIYHESDIPKPENYDRLKSERDQEKQDKADMLAARKPGQKVQLSKKGFFDAFFDFFD